MNTCKTSENMYVAKKKKQRNSLPNMGETVAHTATKKYKKGARQWLALLLRWTQTSVDCHFGGLPAFGGDHFGGIFAGEDSS